MVRNRVAHSPGGISRFTDTEVILLGGTKANTVVLASGYDNTRTSMGKILGNKVADYYKDFCDLDEKGEVNAVSFLL